MSSLGFSPPPQEPPPDLGVDLREALTKAPLAIGVTRGSEHIVELLNPAAEALLGIPPAAHPPAVGRPLRVVAPTLAGCGVIDLLDRVYAAGQPHHEPERRMLVQRDGRCEERVISLTCQPLRGQAGVIGLQLYGEDRTEQFRVNRRLGFLVEAGPALLEASLEHQDALDRAAHLAIKALGELCVINLLQPDGSLRRAAVVHADPEMSEGAEQLKLLPPLPNSPNHQVLRTGRPMVLRHLADQDPWSLASRGQRTLLDRLNLASSLVVPIKARGRMLGTISVSSQQHDRYHAEEIALAEGLALRAGLAMDTAGLYDSERRARTLADRAVAGTTGLLRATAALSGALSPTAIAEVVISRGMELLGASAAALFVRIPDGLELVHAIGWPLDIRPGSRLVPLPGGIPLTDAVLQGIPVWLECPEDVLTRYPQAASAHRSSGHQTTVCLPLIVEGTVVGALTFSCADPHPFSTDEQTFLLALAGQCAQALDRARLYAAERTARAAAEQQRDRIAVLAEASLALDASQSQQQRLQRLTQLAVPRIADWCAVHLLRDGRVEKIAYAHHDPGKIAIVKELTRHYPLQKDGSGSAAQVIRTGQPELISEFSERMVTQLPDSDTYWELICALGVASAMIVPLTVRSHTLGTLTLVSEGDGHRFGPDDLAFAQNLATRAALALDNARLYEEQRNIAATLQAALLPHELPSIPGVALAGRYIAAGEANEVGGDLYDVFALCDPHRCGGPGPWSLVIGDVCGKGPGAAALTALIRYTIRAEASRLLPPCEVLLRLNEAIIRQLASLEARFCTVIYGQLTRTEDGIEVAMACAGHLAPRVLRRCGEIEVGTAGGTILGVYAKPSLAREDVHLRPGDSLVLVTDGVTEARGLDGFYGEDRLDALLTRCRGRSADSIAGLITEDVLDFQFGTPRDDVAVLVVQAISE